MKSPWTDWKFAEFYIHVSWSSTYVLVNWGWLCRKNCQKLFETVWLCVYLEIKHGDLVWGSTAAPDVKVQLICIASYLGRVACTRLTNTGKKRKEEEEEEQQPDRPYVANLIDGNPHTTWILIKTRKRMTTVTSTKIPAGREATVRSLTGWRTDKLM